MILLINTKFCDGHELSNVSNCTMSYFIIRYYHSISTFLPRIQSLEGFVPEANRRLQETRVTSRQRRQTALSFLCDMLLFQFDVWGKGRNSCSWRLPFQIIRDYMLLNYHFVCFFQAQDMMLSLESLAYKADDAGGEFNAAQREVGCQQSCWKVDESPLLSTKIIIVLS